MSLRISLTCCCMALIASSSLPAGEMASPSQIFCEEDRLTGNWLGLRDGLAEDGVTFELYGTQFYQGVTSGGLQQEGEYGGKFDYLAHGDGAAWGLPGFFIDMHGESRLGTTVNQIDGLLTPSNIAMAFPEPEGNVTALTALKLTQALSPNFAIFAGKINTLDEYPIRYSAAPSLSRPGIGGFMNTSLVFNPIAARTVPYSAAAVGAAILHEGEPVFSLTIMDPEERATIGLEGLYEEGVTIVPDLVLKGELFDRPTLLNIGGTYGTADYQSVDPASYLLIPMIGLVSQEESGSWSFYANGYHALWVDSNDRTRTWGVFGQFGVSDGNPNPVRFVANGGVAGRSMLRGRTLDTFGAAFFYVGLSDEIKTLTAQIRPQQDEYGTELFYNFAVTKWCRLTADLQVVRPSTQRLETAVIPGMRLELTF